MRLQCFCLLLPIATTALLGCQNEFDLQVEQEVWTQVNQERRAVGLSDLIMEPRVRRAARDHSKDMAAHDYVSHESLSGATLEVRLRRKGIMALYVGENIIANIPGTDAKETARIAVEKWMASPDHAPNILLREYTHTGVGVARNDRDKFIITQDFVVL